MEIFLSVSEGKQLSDICLSIPPSLDLLVYWSIIIVLTRPRVQIDAKKMAAMGGYKTAASANTAFFGLTKKVAWRLEGLSGRFINTRRSAVIRRAFLSSLHRTMCDARPGLEIFKVSKQVSDICLSLFLS